MYIKKVNKMLLVMAGNDLAQKIERLAEDLISLGYDEKTEQHLLSILERVYLDIKGVTASDVNWDAIIKKNKANKDRIKKERQQSNQGLQGEEEKRIAVQVEKLDNVIKVDFANKQGDRMAEITKSLQKINQLMSELKSKKGRLTIVDK